MKYVMHCERGLERGIDGFAVGRWVGVYIGSAHHKCYMFKCTRGEAIHANHTHTYIYISDISISLALVW